MHRSTKMAALTGLEAEAAALARDQSGAISRRQVLALGGSDAWIAARLRAGRWQRLFSGTYVVFSGPVPFVTRVTAALLRAGVGALEGILADVELGAQSPLELEYLRRVVRAHQLPVGVHQQRLAGHTVRWVDVDHEEFGTRVELDGRLGHVEEGAFRDRRRDNAATREGRATLRYGFVEVFGDPCEVADEVAHVLSANGWTDRPKPCGPRCALPERGGMRML